MDKTNYQVPKMEPISQDFGLNGIILCASPVNAQSEGFTEYELFED